MADWKKRKHDATVEEREAGWVEAYEDDLNVEIAVPKEVVKESNSNESVGLKASKIVGL